MLYLWVKKTGHLFCNFFVLYKKDYPLSFFLIMTLEHTNQSKYLNQITYKLPLLIKQSGEVELDNPTLLPL